MAVKYCSTQPKECTCKKNCNEPTNNKTARKKRTGDDRSRSNVVDKYVSTPEEKAALKASIESEISSRWRADMKSDSWLSKNVRPLTLIVVISFLVVTTFFDGLGYLQVDPAWISLWNMLSVTVVGGYFAVRSLDKRGNVK